MPEEKTVAGYCEYLKELLTAVGSGRAMHDVLIKTNLEMRGGQAKGVCLASQAFSNTTLVQGGVRVGLGGCEVGGCDGRVRIVEVLRKRPPYRVVVQPEPQEG